MIDASPSLRPTRVLALMGGVALFGQERGNIEALCALRDAGADVLCLVRDDSNTRIPGALDARQLSWRPVPFTEHRTEGRLLQFLFRNPVAFVGANLVFLRIVSEYRPTHFHAPNQSYVVNFLIGLLLARQPLIYRAGDEPTVHNWAWRAIWRFVVWRTSSFVANSHFVARSLVSHGVAESRVSVIYNAPPWREQPSQPRSVSTLAPRDPEILYIGQVSEHKGVHLLVEAFRNVAANFPTAKLTIVGRISDWRGDAWARALRSDTASDPLIGDRVSFVGETEEIGNLLDRCIVHVAPSLFDDPAPNVLMEAKVASRPSIVFPKGGMPEMVVDGVDGTVCSRPTVSCLQEALGTYLSQPEISIARGRAARASLHSLGVMNFKDLWSKIYGIRQNSAPDALTSPHAGKTPQVD